MRVALSVAIVMWCICNDRNCFSKYKGTLELAHYVYRTVGIVLVILVIRVHLIYLPVIV